MKLKKASHKKTNEPSYPHYKEYVENKRSGVRKIALTVATIAATGTLAGAVLTGCGDGESHRTAGVVAISRPADPTALTTGTGCNGTDVTTSSWIGQPNELPIEPHLLGEVAQPQPPRLLGKVALPQSPEFLDDAVNLGGKPSFPVQPVKSSDK